MKNYTFTKSTKKYKKCDVFYNDRFITSFGYNKYKQFFDKIRLYAHKNHYDEKKRDNYYSRFGTTAKFESAKYFSHIILW